MGCIGDVMSKLLIDEYPLQVLPSLAKAIGLNEAIFLQQAHYWLKHAKVEHDGKMWFYKTFDAWHEQDFSFWSTRTIKRTVNNLVDLELLLVEKLANNSFNRVNHYTVNYEKLAEIKLNQLATTVVVDSDKLAQSEVTECHQHSDKLAQSDSDKLAQSLRDLEDINKESGHAQKIEGDVLAMRDSNTESIMNWQPPSKETMQSQLIMAGAALQMTDGQYQLHVDDFKAYYEQQAQDGKPIKRENLRQSKFRNWLINIAKRNPAEKTETAARPHSNRSDAFSNGNEPKLTRQQQIDKNKQAMQQAGLSV